MLKEFFISRHPSHFSLNPLVRSFLISEMFLWSGVNLVIPIFAIFAKERIIGGGVEIAGSAYSVHLIARLMFDLVSGRYFGRRSEVVKIIVVISCVVLMSIGYIGLALSSTIWQLFFFQALVGIGLGTSTPLKYTVFSQHIDQDKMSVEWSLYDSAMIGGMAVSAALGGFIANAYSFRTLFIIAAVVNAMSILPYAVWLTSQDRERTLLHQVLRKIYITVTGRKPEETTHLPPIA